MSSDAHHSQALQRKVIRALVAVVAILVVIGAPLVVFDDFRLDLARDLRLVPGSGAERLADVDDDATLVVIPLGDFDGVGQQRYRYKAQFIGRPVEGGVELTDIDSGKAVTISLTELTFIASDAEGTYILFRGPAPKIGTEQAVVVDTGTLTAEVLPEGQTTPDLEGDWETPVWDKVTGLCDRYSPEEKFVACFNRADAASYLAGDWQIDIQLYGDFRTVEPVYRGAGFLPVVGFAKHDTWLYFQNENGIWRIEIPSSLQERT